MAISLILSLILTTIIRFTLAEDPGLSWIWPPPVGFDINTASVAPCGGFNTSHDGNITYFIDQLRWNQTATQITYMTRLTQNLNVADPNLFWTTLVPTLEALVPESNAKESSQFCVPVPERPETDTSVFQLIANTPAGIVFACSKVRFARDAQRSYAQSCNPSIKGNSTVSDTTDEALLSAAMLPAGSTATVSTKTVTSTPTISGSGSQSNLSLHGKSHLSGGAIAGIVIGSLLGVFALVAGLFFLLRLRRKKTAATNQAASMVRKPSAATSTTFSASSPGDSHAMLNKECGPTELAADVPAELDSSQRVELPATDSEKMYRPELAGDAVFAPYDEKDPALFRDEEVPRTPSLATVVSPNRQSYDGTVGTMSPISGNNSDDMSPVSPIAPDSPVFHRMSLH